MRLSILLAAVLFAWNGLAAVGNTNQLVKVQLTWDPVTNPTVTGTRLYYGVATRTYTNSVDAGTNIVATVTNLYANTTYYFSAVNYNAQNVESVFSNEVSYTPFNAAPTNAPSQLRVTFQMQASSHPSTNFQNLAGATVTITNEVNPLVPGYFYRTLINTATLNP